MKVYIGNASDILAKYDNDISCFHVQLFKEDSYASFVLLKYIIDKEGYKTDYYVDYGVFKKPFIKGLHYNISHSKGKIAIAIADNEVGVDIQKMVDTIVIAKPKYYHIHDYKQNLLHMWVIKESYLKFIGVGLRNDLYNIRIKEETVEYPGYETGYYHLYDLGDNFALSICSEKKEEIEIIYV